MFSPEEGPSWRHSGRPVFSLHKLLFCEVVASSVWVWWTTVLEPVAEVQAPSSDGEKLVVAAMSLLNPWRRD